jgi:hypothetical protein
MIGNRDMPERGSPTWRPLVAADRSAATVDRATAVGPVTDRMPPLDGAQESPETRRSRSR